MSVFSRQGHGCPECQGWIRFGDRQIPDHLEPAGVALDVPVGAWSSLFRRCRHCGAWWCLTFDPKEIAYVDTPVPPAIAPALRADATLEQAWPFLFAPAPVDEIFENYLYAGRFDPQAALDRLLARFAAADDAPAEQADILRMLARLLELRNPHHAALQQQRGWVWDGPEPVRFEQPLLAFEARFTSPDPRFAPYGDPHGRENMRSLRAILERNASGARRIFRGRAPRL